MFTAEEPVYVAAYDIGLTSGIVFDPKSANALNAFYDFTARFIEDLNEAFGISKDYTFPGVQALFLCELGSQRQDDRNLNTAMKARRDHLRVGTSGLVSA